MIRTICTASLLFAAMSTGAADLKIEDQKEESYVDAQALGRCAGFLSFMSKIYEAEDKPFQAKDANQKSNGWRIATMGALLAAGWKSENIPRTADSIYQISETNWMAALDLNCRWPSIKKQRFVCLKINPKNFTENS
ncbi:MAG: hypothetical protein K2Q13_06570 [Nitrosomonas sp.]|uniref:hypothetical protein n=1 Tax=Nitrosomonas sp. TaxID=42353 RepID=UPI0025E9E29D|nr:hypothetical protein [Nitrosomonas sp.]MBY0474707.1 hypothetical protein [Nitrosomonas sp.]